MNKNKKQGYIIFGIVFVLYNILAFAIPSNKNSTFWIAYIFTFVAFLAQIFIWKAAFDKAETLKSKFLGFPVIHIGIVYLIIQLIAFAIFMAVPALKTWISIIVCGLILGISAVCMMATEVGKDEINRIDQKVQQKVLFIKEVQTDIELLANAEQDKDVKNVLAKLVESVRYSDPMSNNALSELEEKIIEKLSELKASDDKIPIIKELDLMIAERNQKCKMLK